MIFSELTFGGRQYESFIINYSMNFKTAFTAALFAASTQAGSSIIDLVGEAEDTLPPIGLPGFILPPVLTTRYAYCKMQWDPYYPTTNPYGQFKMK